MWATTPAVTLAASATEQAPETSAGVTLATPIAPALQIDASLTYRRLPWARTPAVLTDASLAGDDASGNSGRLRYRTGAKNLRRRHAYHASLTQASVT